MRRQSVLLRVLPGLPMLPPSMLLMPSCLPPLRRRRLLLLRWGLWPLRWRLVGLLLLLLL